MLEPTILDSATYSETFARVCDVVWRTLAGVALDDDGPRHTSDQARAVARAVLSAVNIVQEPPASPPPAELPADLHSLWSISYDIHGGDLDTFLEHVDRLRRWRLRRWRDR